MLASHFIRANGQDLHCKIGSNDGAPVMLMLHGFPEYWAAWAAVAERLLDQYRIILPDQRGFNLSSKPMAEDDYATKNLVADMLGLLDHLAPHQKVILCGHDWGASVAYALAMRHPQRFSHLIIANGVHPMCFQKGLMAAGPQRAASQYMNVLRATGSEDSLSADNFAKLLRMLEKFSTTTWMDEATREDYRTAWAQPGALSAMLNWYRQSPMVVPELEEPHHAFELTEDMKQRYRISVPHLLLWGQKDTALLDAAREDLPLFCDSLTIREHAKGSHWILHEQPDWVAQEMRAFIATA